MAPYLLDPLEEGKLYRFDPDALTRERDTHRFLRAVNRVKKLMYGRQLFIVAHTPAQAAAKIAKKCGSDRYNIGNDIDDILLFALPESSGYCPGFMQVKTVPPLHSTVRRWLSRYYDKRDLGITLYSRMPRNMKSAFAKWFSQHHRFQSAFNRDRGLSDVGEILSMVDNNEPPNRKQLSGALKSILTHRHIYTDAQVRNIYNRVQRENERLGTEENQRQYVDTLLETLRREYF